MKKIFLILSILALLFLNACADSENDSAKTANSNDTHTNSSGENTNANEETKYVFLVDNADKNTISIQIPLVKDGSEQQLNFIVNTIKEKLKSFSGEDFDLTVSETDITNKNDIDNENLSGYYIVAQSEISYESEDMVSMIFEAHFNKSGTAHPTDWFFAINYNPKTLENIAFSDNYSVDEGLYNVFAQHAEKALLESFDGEWPDGWDSFSEMLCSKDSFLQGMKTEKEFAYYYTNEGVGISYPINHALGDHKEVVIPFADLATWSKKDAQ